jgi:DNA-binding transcriptional ArsR family regulator
MEVEGAGDAGRGTGATDEDMDRAAELFGVLANAHRLKIIRRLADRELDVGQLATALDFNQPNVSQHLRRLRDDGIVVSQRHGSRVVNRLSTPLTTALCELGCRLAAELDPSRPEHRPNQAKETEKR